MPFVERYLNVAVRLTDCPGVVVDRIERREISADVVHYRHHFAWWDRLTDHLLHIGEARGGFFDTHPYGCPHVHQYLAAIDLWEEVAAEKRGEQEGDGHKTEEATYKHPAMLDGQCE